MVFEPDESLTPEPSVGREPHVELTERLGVERVDAVLRFHAGTHEPGSTQHA